MAFEKIEYISGDVLTADQMNKIQDAIIQDEGNIEAHIGNKSNPHGVTAKQIGAPTVTEMNTAIDASKEIFLGRYGVTTSAEIEAAYQSGKFCTCVSADGKNRYILYARVVSNQHLFLHPTLGAIQCKADVWSEVESTASVVGADASGTATSAVSAHNTDTSAHSDIRTALNGKAPTAHAVNANTYGVGNANVFGHVKISDKTDSTSVASAGIAASPAAVKAAYDLANSKASTVTYTASVPTGWTASGSYFYKDVTVSGILATDNPVVDINCGSDNAANALYSDAICQVFRIVTSANSIRLWAKKNITTAFPIQLKVVR